MFFILGLLRRQPLVIFEEPLSCENAGLYLVDDAGNWSERKDVRFVRMMQGDE
jgi:hypothetical protein